MPLNAKKDRLVSLLSMAPSMLAPELKLILFKLAWDVLVSVLRQ